MILKDTFTIAANIEEVWAFLRDIPEMSSCLPGATGVSESAAGVYKGKLTSKVGAIKANFSGEATIEEEVPPARMVASFNAKDRALGTAVSGKFSAELTVVEEGTELAYEMDIAMRGRLASIGHTVVQQTAKKMTRTFINCVTDRLTE